MGAIAEMMLYRFGWAIRAAALLDSEVSAARTLLQPELEQYVRDQVTAILSDEELQGLVETALSAESPVASLKRRPAFFDARLVEDLDVCASSTAASVEGFRGLREAVGDSQTKISIAGINASFGQHHHQSTKYGAESASAHIIWTQASNSQARMMSPMYSGLSSSSSKSLSASPAWFADGQLPWFESDESAANAQIETAPWELDEVGSSLATVIGSAVLAQPGSEHAEILRDMRQFVVLQTRLQTGFRRLPRRRISRRPACRTCRDHRPHAASGDPDASLEPATRDNRVRFHAFASVFHGSVSWRCRGGRRGCDRKMHRLA